MEDKQKKINEQEAGLDAWDEYTSGSFLKAINVTSEDQSFEVTEISNYVDEADSSKRLRLKLKKENLEFDFDLNKTNAGKVKELGITSPKDLKGKKIYFKKVLVRNPKTGMEVEGLRIYKVE